jgi:hypothetical protein
LPKCRHQNSEGRRFCAECGSALPVVCQACGFSNNSGDKFCGGCGAALASEPAPLGSSFESDPSKKAPPTAPTGERRQATIVFSDLSGYTAMNEKLDPEEVERIMSRIKAVTNSDAMLPLT